MHLISVPWSMIMAHDCLCSMWTHEGQVEGERESKRDNRLSAVPAWPWRSHPGCLGCFSAQTHFSLYTKITWSSEKLTKCFTVNNNLVFNLNKAKRRIKLLALMSDVMSDENKLRKRKDQTLILQNKYWYGLVSDISIVCFTPFCWTKKSSF